MSLDAIHAAITCLRTVAHILGYTTLVCRISVQPVSVSRQEQRPRPIQRPRPAPGARHPRCPVVGIGLVTPARLLSCPPDTVHRTTPPSCHRAQRLAVSRLPSRTLLYTSLCCSQGACITIHRCPVPGYATRAGFLAVFRVSSLAGRGWEAVIRPLMADDVRVPVPGPKQPDGLRWLGWDGLTAGGRTDGQTGSGTDRNSGWTGSDKDNRLSIYSSTFSLKMFSNKQKPNSYLKD